MTWMSNCLRNTLIRNGVMYLFSHPLMVLPLLRITQGKQGVGMRAQGHGRRRGGGHWSLRRREQGLKSEGEQDNKELNKRNNGHVKACKKDGVRKKKKGCVRGIRHL